MSSDASPPASSVAEPVPAEPTSEGSGTSTAASDSPIMTSADRRRRRKQRQRDRKKAEEAAKEADVVQEVEPAVAPEEVAKAEALKKEGNVAFMQKNFEVADAKYTEALKHDATNKFVLGNRSAARRHLKDFSGALSDATAAVSHAPEWPKGYFRQAEALLSLNRPRDAATACSIAHRLDPKSKSIAKQWHHCLRIADQIDRTVVVESGEHWLRIFKHIGQKRLRLAVLAHFWNKSSKTERFAVFHKFMEVMSADSADTLARYTADHMIELPLQNYENIIIPDTWMQFFVSLDAETKVVMFKGMWTMCSGAEQSLIIKDFRFFFLSPVGHI